MSHPELELEEKGFIADTRAFITQIKNNLQGYQSGYPVIRELIQNADDGGAARVCLALCPPLGLEHPVTDAPGLLIVNDGHFRTTDQQAIRRLGLGHKIVESDTIGKFGLGLKSVFHMSELFFFGASQVLNAKDQVAAGRFATLLNPWSGLEHPTLGKHYASWNHFSSLDQSRLLELLGKVTWKQWFFVYLPFRKRCLCPRDSRNNPVAITSNFPGDPDDADKDLARWWPNLAAELAPVFPMLRHLRSFEQVRLDGSGQVIERVASLELSSRSARTEYPGSLRSGQEQPLAGSLSLTRADLKVDLSYGGQEAQLADPCFEALRWNAHWPRQPVLFVEGEEHLQSDDKNAPHAAAYLVQRPGEGGELRLRLATFLPVGDPLERLELPVNLRVDLILHGFFFVDPSRSRVRLPQAPTEPGELINEEQLTESWNHHIFHRGTLPMVLLAVARLSAHGKLSHSQVAALTGALQRSELSQSHQASLCKSFSWECRLSTAEFTPTTLPDEHEVTAIDKSGRSHLSRWALLPAKLDPAPLTLPEGTENELLDTFPNLRQLAGQTAVLRPGLPRISLTPARGWLTPSELNVLLGEKPRAFFDDLVNDLRSRAASRSRRFELLHSFLAASWTNPTSQPYIAEWLREFLHLVLTELTYARAKDLRFPLTLLLRLLPPTDRFIPALGPESPESAFEHVRDLNRALRGRLLVAPGSMLVESLGPNPQLEEEQVDAMLRVFHQGSNSNIIDSLTREIVNAAAEDRQNIWARNPNLKLFRAHDAATSTESRHSFAELSRALDQGRLFILKDLLRELETLLSRALAPAAQSPILVLNKASSELAYGPDRIPECNLDSTVRLLKRKPALADASARGALLDRLSRGEPAPQHRPALRYLLHGHAEHFDDSGDLWLLKAEDQSASWPGILASLLSSHREGWRVIDPQATRPLTRQAQEWLGLAPPEEREVVRVLREQADLSFLTVDQRSFLYRSVQDDQDLKAIPLHETLDGRLIAIGPSTFLDSKHSLPVELRSQATLIVPLQDPELRKRQAQLVSPITPVDAARLALQSPSPSSFWQTILEGLSAARETRPDELVQLVRERPWVPMSSGQPVGFAALLYLKGLDSLLEEFFERCSCEYRSTTQVLPEVTGYRAWDEVCMAFLLPEGQVIERLAELLGRPSVPALGKLSHDSEFTEEVLPILDESLQPGARLLNELRKSDHLSGLLRALCRPVDLNRALTLYRWAAEQHAAAKKAAGRRALEKMCLELLGQAVQKPGFRDELATLPLLTEQGNEWKRPDLLCFGLAQVQASSRLAPSFASHLSAHIVEASGVQPGPNQRIASTQDDSLLHCLQALFQADGWKRQPEVTGAFMAIFAPQCPEVAREAERLLKLPDLRGTRAGLFLPEGAVASYTPPNHSQRQMKLHFNLDVIEAAEVETVSLLGSRLRVKIGKNCRHLLLTSSKQKPGLREDTLHWDLQLLAMDPAGLEEAALHELVWMTAWEVISLCYLAERGDRDRAFQMARQYWQEQVLEAGQFDIKVAQKMIEEYFPFYYRLLPRFKQTRLAHEIGLLESLRRKKAEAEASKIVDHRSRGLKEVEESLPVVKARIVRLVREDEEVQASLLDMVRTKVGSHFQYNRRSIPFELFQNADDACSEWIEMEGSGAVNREFLIEIVPEGLLFGHNGRPINQFRSSDGRDYHPAGYHMDLEKMLILQGSDKEVETEGLSRTGKFGLGFKSVFLASDEVEVRSGRRHFHIVGGVYPMEAGARSCLRSRQESEECFDTQILLRPRAEARGLAQWRDEILSNFRTLLPLQLVLANSLDTAVWSEPGAGRRALHWKPTLLDATGSLSTGRLPRLVQTGPERILVLQSPHGKVLIPLGSSGVIELSADIPRCWVTTPLSEVAPSQFLFSGRFTVDIGRHQLAADSDANLQLAERLGKATGELLCQLHALSQSLGWSELLARLELQPELSEDAFWGGIWKAFSVVTARAADEETLPDFERVVRRIETRCLAVYSKRQSVIPTELWGAYAGSTSLNRIRAQAVGILTREAPFRSAQKLLLKHFEPGSLVLGKVVQVLGRVHAEMSVPQLDLRKLLDRVVADDRVTPELASLLAGPCSHLQDPDLESELPAEIGEVKSKLRSYQFESAAGSWARAEKLLTENSPDREEQSLHDFAPGRHRLSPGYGPEGVGLLRQIRQQTELRPEEIADWILALSEPDKQHASLRYLLQGELGRNVASILHSHLLTGRAVWLRNLNEKLLANLGFEPSEARELLRLLLPLTPEPRRPLQLARTSDVPTRLHRLQQWWKANRERSIQRYERRVYPDGRPPALESDRDWLLLLTLGALHTMGRQTSEQSRRFLEKCESKGWLSRLLNLRSNVSGFAEILEEYFAEEDEQEYFHWLRYLPSMYQLSRWLHEYVAMLEEFDKTKGSQSLRDFLRPRSAAYWQGSGMSAPNLKRTLGIGTCFVLRELRRTGRLTKSELDPYCFTPTKRVRERIEALTDSDFGGESKFDISKNIYQALSDHLGQEQATFGLDFDLPVRMISEPEWEAILGG